MAATRGTSAGGRHRHRWTGDESRHGGDRGRLWRWLTHPKDADGLGYGLTIFGTVTTTVLAIVVTAGGMLFQRSGCPRALTPSSGSSVCSEFVAEPEFLVWLMLLAAETAVAAVAFVPLLRLIARDVRPLRTDRRGRRDIRSIVAAGAFLLLVAGLFSFASRILPWHLVADRAKLPKVWPLSHFELKTGVIVAMAVGVGFVAIIGIWVAGLRLDRLFRPDPKPMTAEQLVRHRERELGEFLRLRQTVTTFLTLAAAIVGLGTLATGALRNAIQALPKEAGLEFDQQYVLVYGLFFTGLLAIAFLPSFLAMKEAGVRLRDAAQPLPFPTDKEFGARIDARKKLDEFLETSIAASASFKATVAIFTPLATALVGLLLPRA